MKVLLTGATGFVGGHLTQLLERGGHTVLPVSRRPRPGGFTWEEDSLRAGVEASDAVVHLAGETVLGRWGAKRKAELRRSRIETTLLLARLLAEKRAAGAEPVFVGASAVGYYGPRGDEEVPESEGPGGDFLATLCRDWEAAAAPARDAGVRVAHVRIGVVMGTDGGALKQMLLPFKLGLGGPVGSGRQAFPWIHVEDLARLFLFLLETPDATGPFNGAAPNPVTMGAFAKALGRALHRPAILPVPGFALKLLLGESSQVLLTGQRAVPARALEAGFRFEHPELDGALAHLLA